MIEQLYTFSDGTELQSTLDALVHLKQNPTLTVEHEKRVGPNRIRFVEDATPRLLGILNDHPYGAGR